LGIIKTKQYAWLLQEPHRKHDELMMYGCMSRQYDVEIAPSCASAQLLMPQMDVGWTHAAAG
jgi:hypothetical protein